MNKRMFTFALAAAMTVMAVPALAQDNFPDVPENHWAFEAIENLKREGILVGYPDGTYKGPRATTRYELAVALNAAYQRLKNVTDGLAEQIAEIRGMMGQNQGGDTRGLADRLAAVEAQLRGMGNLSNDMAAMKRMADEFQKELASLGVDVEAMKKDIDEMKKAIGGGQTQSVKISGDANIVIHAGQGEDDSFAMGIDGRLLGYDIERDQRTGILGDLNVYHELAVNIAGQTAGPKWDATLVFGNLVGGESSFSTPFRSFDVVGGYGNQSGRFGGDFFGEGNATWYVQRFAIDLSESLPFTAVVGRLGAQTTNPYLFKRSDNTPYFENERWDNGNWLFDGAILGFKLGSGSLTVMGGRNSNRLNSNGGDIQPIADDQFTLIENTIGAEAKFGLGKDGNINLAYLVHSFTSRGSNALDGDRLEVYGAGLDYKFGGVTLNANYGVSNVKDNSSDVAPFDDDNTALHVGLGFGGDRWGLNASYRNIETNYLGQGSWERIGTNYSPRNIKDYGFSGHFKLSDAAKLTGGARFGENVTGTDFEFTTWNAKLTYNFSSNWFGSLGYEDVDVDFTGSSSDVKQRWTSIGIGYNMSANSMFRLMYQYGNVENGRSWGIAPGGDYKGHILTSQISIKF